MCHTTHLCLAEGGSDPLSRSPHYYSLAETDSTRLSVCSESFGLKKMHHRCRVSGRPNHPPSHQRVRRGDNYMLILWQNPRPPALPVHHKIDRGNSNCFKLKSEWTDLSWEKSFVPVTLLESTKWLKLQFHHFLCYKTDSFKHSLGWAIVMLNLRYQWVQRTILCIHWK